MAAPVSPGIGDHITKRFWNAEVYERNVDLQSAWTPYQVAWSTPADSTDIGNGKLIAAYKRVGHNGSTVHLRLRLRAGSTTSFGSGLWSFTLPLGLDPITPQTLHGFCGSDTGVERHTVAAHLNAVNGIFRIASKSGSGLTATSPFTWANGYQLILGGTYEIA